MADNRYDRGWDDRDRGWGGPGDRRDFWRDENLTGRGGERSYGGYGDRQDSYGGFGARGRENAWSDDRAAQYDASERRREDERSDYAPRRRRETRYDQRGRSSASGLDAFDRSLQITHIWLNEIVDEIGPDKQIAWHVLGGVLRALRDRMPIELAAHLGAQLPTVIRGTYYDQFRPGARIERTRHLDDFLNSVADHMRGIGRPIDPYDALCAVFRTLARHISDGQMSKVVQALPTEVQDVWARETRRIMGPEAGATDENRRDRAPWELVARDR